MNRIKAVAWWRWPVAAIPLAAIVYVALNENLATLIAIVVAIAAVVLMVWNPFAARPRPLLALRPNGQEAATSVVLGDHWRPVDVDAVVDNARQIVEAPDLNRSLRVLGGLTAKPTEKDLETYRSEVRDYLAEMKGWAERSAEWLATNASVLEVHVFQENDSDVDAEDAKVTIVFPEGTESRDAGDLEAPQEPVRPQLKTRLGPLMQALQPWRGAPGAFYDDRPAIDFSMTDVQRHSIDEPNFNELPDGRLEVSYRRQAIRHREVLPSGEPFTVRLPLGQHEITWRITAKNLPHPKTGIWTVSCPTEASGEPIKSLGSLQAAIAGEPEVDMEELFASRRSHLKARIDEEA